MPENLDELHDDGDNEIIEDTKDTDLENQDAGENTDANNDGDQADKNKNTDEPELKGMDKFLADYGVIGGMINFEGDEEKHFNDLSDEEKYNVINTLVTSHQTPIEQKYGLDGEEIQILNYFRSQDKPIQEALDELVEKRLAQISLLQSATSTDFTKMDSDAIYMKWLKESNPEAIEEDLQSDLEAAKKLKNYDKQAENIRKTFISEQEKEVKLAAEQEKITQLAELEADREAIVKGVADIQSIAGFTVENNEKNEILESLLEVNEHGDSLFMEEVFSDPQKLFKAAYMYKNGEKLLDEMADYFKKQMQVQYQKGKADALKGSPNAPIIASNSADNKRIEDREKVNSKTVDELHED